MAQKLEQDLNFIQRSGIEIQVDPLTRDLNIIQKLDDEPNDVGGLSAQELKTKFDEAGNTIKDYINDSLIPQVLGDGLTEQNRQENELARQANEQTRQENEAARVQAEEAREQAAAQLNQSLTGSVNELEERLEEAEEARTVWEDYDPQKNYVPGNKVYYLGSSYVNTAPCTDVLPTVEANWQMIAKKGADSDEGMSQEEADLRYLQLTGGRLTGELRVLDPERDDNPATKGYVTTVLKGKQNTLSGSNGRFLGFNTSGAPVSEDVPSHFLRMIIFQSSGTFSPSSYGLAAGDIINVICVGGGGGGYHVYDYDVYEKYKGENGKGYGAGSGGGYCLNETSPNHGFPGGGSGIVARKTIRLTSSASVAATVGKAGAANKAGESSSFGSYLTAPGGTAGSYDNTPGTGYRSGGRGVSRSLLGGRGGEPGESGGIDSYFPAGLTYSGGGGAGGFEIPFSALTETTVGSGDAGDGVVVVYW